MRRFYSVLSISLMILSILSTSNLSKVYAFCPSAGCSNPNGACHRECRDTKCETIWTGGCDDESNNSCFSDTDCKVGGGGGGDRDGGSGCDANNWGVWSACSVTCGGGTQTRTNECGNSQTQTCNIHPCATPTPIPTPTPTPLVIPVMGLKLGNLNAGSNVESILLSWQDFVPVDIRSRAVTSQIAFMEVLFSGSNPTIYTSSFTGKGKEIPVTSESDPQKSEVQNVIFSILSILNPFSF